MKSKVVIFGGSGFLGEKLVERLYKKKDILVVARNEGNLVALEQQFPCINIMTGDIADMWVVKKAMQEAEEIYLLSAFKHVGLAEKDTKTCVKSNVLGTLNVIEESLHTKPKLLMFISTDKAAQVSGVYGASKLLGERLMQEAQIINPKTKYRVVRYGNVIYSTGSVLCKWKDKIQKGQEVILTDPEATRFFWTRDEAIDLIFRCIKKAKDSKPYIPKMKAMRMLDILNAMQDKYGGVENKFKIIGLQSGENKHETMDGKVYSNQVPKFTREEIIKKI